jgi:hypothetical protein
LGLLPNNLVLKKSAKQYQIFGRLANVGKFAPVWKTSTSSLFEDHLRRKRFAQNFSHLLPSISFDLVGLKNPKIQQLLQRLFVSSAKQFFKNPRAMAKKKEEILSLLGLLVQPAFTEGKLVKPFSCTSAGSSSRVLTDKSDTLTALANNISSKILYPSISAHVVAGYIRRQMASPQKLEDLDFRINLKTGISMLALFLFKRFPLGSSIQGLRIVCSGKWSKTRSGRKQRLVYNRGSLKRLTFSALLDYGTSTVTTKFGVCSIKV